MQKLGTNWGQRWPRHATLVQCSRNIVLPSSHFRGRLYDANATRSNVKETSDGRDSKSSRSDPVRVRVPPPVNLYCFGGHSAEAMRKSRTRKPGWSTGTRQSRAVSEKFYGRWRLGHATLPASVPCATACSLPKWSTWTRIQAADTCFRYAAMRRLRSLSIENEKKSRTSSRGD
jgi:hypothetical protein